MLKSFEDYNKQMGGADLLDQVVFTYRYRIRSKKWCWHFFTWTVNALTALFRSKKNDMLEFQREVAMIILEEKSLQSHWRFLKILQAMWSLIPKITSLWKAHQNIVAVNAVVVNQSFYARNPMLPYTLTVSKTIILETQKLLYRFLPEMLIM